MRPTKYALHIPIESSGMIETQAKFNGKSRKMLHRHANHLRAFLEKQSERNNGD